MEEEGRCRRGGGGWKNRENERETEGRVGRKGREERKNGAKMKPSHPVGAGALSPKGTADHSKKLRRRKDCYHRPESSPRSQS